MNNIIGKADYIKNIIKVIFFILFCLAVVLVMFSISSFVISKTDFNYEILNTFTSAILAVSALFSGFMISRWFKENGLILGIFSGIVISLFVVVSALILKTLNFNPAFITKLIITIISGAAGGIVGVNIN